MWGISFKIMSFKGKYKFIWSVFLTIKGIY